MPFVVKQSEPLVLSADPAPNAEVSLFPWKDKPENVKLAVRHIRTFLRANRP